MFTNLSVLSAKWIYKNKIHFLAQIYVNISRIWVSDS